MSHNYWEDETVEAICTLCDETSIVDHSLIRHLTYMGETFTCEECNKLLAMDKWDLVLKLRGKD